MTFHPLKTTAPLTALVLAILVLLAPGTVASADDATVAWSVSPAGADGAADGRTRVELGLDPGGTATDHVLIANASTTDQTFSVYGADAFNTADGGYDLLVAGTPSTDAGSWVTVDQPQVTVPALKTAVVAVTVTAPAGATPGDHAAGIVVSRAQPATDAQGVVLDTRVAVRLAVRISGELTPTLTVQDVHVDYSSSLAPFGPSDADLTYTVKNTGNVTVVGEPRVRITGPFGIVLADQATVETQEVLPGQSFTVRTALGGVEPALVDTAVVDVKMAAAPGPDTEIPLVSSTARSTFAAIPWTGLLLLALIGATVWWLIRRRRARRAEGEAMWAELVDQAKAGQLPGDASERPAPTGGAVLSVLVVGAALIAGGLALLGGAPPASAVEPTVAATVQLAVPAAPATAAAQTAATTTQTTTSAGTTTKTSTTTTGTGLSSPADGSEVQSQVLADEGAGSTPSKSARVLGVDTVWRAASGLTPAQRGLVALSVVLLLGGAGFGVRALVLARAGRGVA